MNNVLSSKGVLSPEEAISYIENYGWSTTRLGLERTRALLHSLGDPQKNLRFVHVAGSNGKGSTCSMLASILTAAGYKTGLYISPYIEIFNERIQIDGEYIPGERLAEITTRVKAIADAMDDHPSQFELVTAIAIQYYYEEKCDIVVLEVGMGGALDSTNAIDAPEVAVITNIGLEHTEYLGDTLEEIAETKGGIIKPGCNCVCYDGAPAVVSTIRDICMEKDVPISVVDFTKVMPLSSGLDGQRFSWHSNIKAIADTDYANSSDSDNDHHIDNYFEYNLALLGKHQLHNAAVVLETIDVLSTRGWKIDNRAVEFGLANVKWPARFEVLAKDPVFILDGGHNPQCAEALAEGIEEYLPGEKIVFLLGVLADKDYVSIVDMMMPYAEEFICVTPLSDRALNGATLAEFIIERGGKATSADTISQGIIAAKRNIPVIAFGSLYLAGAVRKEFGAANKQYLRSHCIERRDSLTKEERIEKSRAIVDNLMDLDEYKSARNILIYKWIRGEVRLDELEKQMEEESRVDADSINESKISSSGEGKNKTLFYPVCVDDGSMIAVSPGEGKDRWDRGPFDILEPVREKGLEIDPEAIDLVIVPLTGFDEDCNRLGMGGGYYDRYLPQCINAVKIGVAFEVQKANQVPVEPHDSKLDMVITEKRIYCG